MNGAQRMWKMEGLPAADVGHTYIYTSIYKEALMLADAYRHQPI